MNGQLTKFTITGIVSGDAAGLGDMKKIIFIIIIILVVHAGYKLTKIYLNSIAFKDSAVKYLDMVTVSPQEQLKAQMAADAKAHGFELKSGDIVIKSEDTERQTLVTRMVDGRVANVTNKLVSIHLRYSTTVYGIPIRFEAEQSKIVTVKVEAPERRI
jgi:hypothetical protein